MGDSPNGVRLRELLVMTSHKQDTPQDELTKKLHDIQVGGRTFIKLSYPNDYPETHDRLHIAGVTLEGLSEQEEFVNKEVLGLIETEASRHEKAAQERLLDELSDMVSPHSEVITKEDLVGREHFVTHQVYRFITTKRDELKGGDKDG